MSKNWSAASDLLLFKHDLNSLEILLVTLHQAIFNDFGLAHLCRLLQSEISLPISHNLSLF